MPDTGPLPPASILSFYSNSLQISNWNIIKSQIVAPTADPSVGDPEFDGTLPVKDTATFPGFAQWLPPGSAPPIFVAKSVNGYFTPTMGIYLLQGMGSSWILEIDCEVGGVPDILWAGEKVFGNCPAGTYMRVGAFSLSPGPLCMIVEEVDNCPPTLAWWRMEVGTLPQVDTVNGNVMALFQGVIGSFSNIVGHVGNALSIDSTLGGVSSTNGPQSATLSVSNNGITIACWVRITDPTPDIGSLTQFRFNFDFNGAPHNVIIKMQNGVPGVGIWTAVVDSLGGPVGSIVSAAGWNFLAFTYNPVTGASTFNMNQAGAITGTYVLGGGTSAGGDVGLESSGLGGGRRVSDFDEIAIYEGVLTNAQLNMLYNGGAGQTWPF